MKYNSLKWKIIMYLTDEMRSEIYKRSFLFSAVARKLDVQMPIFTVSQEIIKRDRLS